MSKLKFLTLVSTIVLLGLTAAPAMAQSPISVAIMPATEGQLTHWWGWDWNLAEGVTNLIIDETVKRGKLSVVERSQLDRILAEQDLGDTGRIEADTAAQIGRLLGARLLVLSTITEWQMTETGGVGISFLRVSGSMARVKITGRVVDAETGVVLGSFEGSGSSTGVGFNINSYRGLDINGEQFGGSTLGKATTAAITQYVDEMIKVVEREAARLGTAEQQQAQTGQVMAVIGQQIVINLGSKHGVKMNMEFGIVHPQVIPGLKDPVHLPIGSAKVVSVQPESAVLQIISKSQDIAVGDLVTMQ